MTDERDAAAAKVVVGDDNDDDAIAIQRTAAFILVSDDDIAWFNAPSSVGGRRQPLLHQLSSSLSVLASFVFFTVMMML